MCFGQRRFRVNARSGFNIFLRIANFKNNKIEFYPSLLRALFNRGIVKAGQGEISILLRFQTHSLGDRLVELFETQPMFGVLFPTASHYVEDVIRAAFGACEALATFKKRENILILKVSVGNVANREEFKEKNSIAPPEFFLIRFSDLHIGLGGELESFEGFEGHPLDRHLALRRHVQRIVGLTAEAEVGNLF